MEGRSCALERPDHQLSEWTTRSDLTWLCGAWANLVPPAHRLASRGRGLRRVRPRAVAVPGRWAGPAVGSSWRGRVAAARAGGGEASLIGEARLRGLGSPCA